MKLLNIVAGLAGSACAAQAHRAAQAPLAVLDNSAAVSRIPTSYESAVMGRRILALSKLATFSTVFPGHHSDAETREGQPGGLGGVPVGLVDYVADCEHHGSPTVLAIKVGTSFRNVRNGSHLTISMRWTPPIRRPSAFSLLSRLAAYLRPSDRSPYDAPPEHPDVPDTVPYSAANLPRFSLLRRLEAISANESAAAGLAACYTRKHQDARYWLPGNRIHASEWMRLVVTHVYWIGGFGDRAYIGWIPADEWRNVTKGEWESIHLPGEKKGWNEWESGRAGEL